MQEQRPQDHPRRAQARRQLRVFQPGHQREEHSLGGVLQEIGVRALGAVELLGFGLCFFGGSLSVNRCLGGWRESGGRKETHISLALFNGRVGVGVGDLGLLPGAARDDAVDEPQDGDGAQRDGDDGAV